jgi:hypothetical protein
MRSSTHLFRRYILYFQLITNRIFRILLRWTTRESVRVS